MIYIRSTLFTLFLLVFTPIWSVLCLLAFPFLSPENRYRFIGLWNKIVIWLLWMGGYRVCIRPFPQPLSPVGRGAYYPPLPLAGEGMGERVVE